MSLIFPCIPLGNGERPTTTRTCNLPYMDLFVNDCSRELFFVTEGTGSENDGSIRQGLAEVTSAARVDLNLCRRHVYSVFLCNLTDACHCARQLRT